MEKPGLSSRMALPFCGPTVATPMPAWPMPADGLLLEQDPMLGYAHAKPSIVRGRGHPEQAHC